MKWECRVLFKPMIANDHGFEAYLRRVEKSLNEVGAEGWELVAAMHESGSYFLETKNFKLRHYPRSHRQLASLMNSPL